MPYLLAIFAVLVALWGAWTLWPADDRVKTAARAIRDPDPAKRRFAQYQLSLYQAENPRLALATLIECLDDKDLELREVGVRNLAGLMGVKGIGDLAPDEIKIAMSKVFAFADDPKSSMRAPALESLWLIGRSRQGSSELVDKPRIMKSLVAGAASTDPATKIAAIQGLWSLGPSVTDDPPEILRIALDDSSKRIRLEAADALARYDKGVSRWLPPLVESLKPHLPKYRDGYTMVLTNIRPRSYGKASYPSLAKALTIDDDEIRSLAASSLGGFGRYCAGRGYVDSPDSTIPALIASAGRPGKNDSNESGIVPRSARPVLTPDHQFRWSEIKTTDPALDAVRALDEILPTTTALKPRPGIDDASLETAKTILQGNSAELRAAMALCLGRFQPRPELVAILGESASDPDVTVRAASCKALHDLADAMPFTPPENLKKTLADESPGVRYWTAGALGHIQEGLDPYLPMLLKRAVDDDDPAVRSVCVSEVADFIRPTAVTSEVVPVLIESLGSSSLPVRSAATGLLGRIGPASPEAVDRLLALLKQERETPSDSPTSTESDNEQGLIIAALGKIAPKTSRADQAGDAIAEAMKNGPAPRTLAEIITALPGFPEQAKRLLPRLKEISEGENARLQQLAKQAMERIHRFE